VPARGTVRTKNQTTRTLRFLPPRTNRFIQTVFTENGDLAALNGSVTRVQRPVGDGRLYVAPVDEDFADIENRLLTRWSSGFAPHVVRYLLRRSLHSASLRQHYRVKP
jgi:hypothetical protein